MHPKQPSVVTSKATYHLPEATGHIQAPNEKETAYMKVPEPVPIRMYPKYKAIWVRVMGASICPVASGLLDLYIELLLMFTHVKFLWVHP